MESDIFISLVACLVFGSVSAVGIWAAETIANYLHWRKAFNAPQLPPYVGQERDES
jgi:hypothetical protein